MGLFLKSRDLELFKRLSKLLVLSVMNVLVLYIKLNISKMKVNMYGLSKRGTILVYKRVKLHCLVQHSPQLMDYSLNVTYTNNTIYKFLKSTLLLHNVVPLIGDFIMWNNQYWLITNITQLQLIGNSSLVLWSKIVLTTIVSDSKVKQLLLFKG